MAIFSSFDITTGVLATTGNSLNNVITASRDAAGTILINGGAVPIVGDKATVGNTALIQVSGQGIKRMARFLQRSYSAVTAMMC